MLLDAVSKLCKGACVRGKVVEACAITMINEDHRLIHGYIFTELAHATKVVDTARAWHGIHFRYTLVPYTHTTYCAVKVQEVQGKAVKYVGTVYESRKKGNTSDDLGTRKRASAMHVAGGHARRVRLHSGRFSAEAKRRSEPAAALLARRIEHL